MNEYMKKEKEGKVNGNSKWRRSKEGEMKERKGKEIEVNKEL